MNDFPKVIRLRRGNKYRIAFMVQPHLHSGGCYDVLRLAFITI